MGKVKHYQLDEIADDDFVLIAIHSSCEGYLMAYLLNTYCHCKFIQNKKGTHPFESYEWIDPRKGIEIRLFSNRCFILKNDDQKGSRLFDLPETKELYLIKDLRNADYIIKINSGMDVQLLMEKMKFIDEISYHFLPDEHLLNLDFSPNLN